MSVRLVTGGSKGTRPEERRRAEVARSRPQGNDRALPSRNARISGRHPRGVRYRWCPKEHHTREVVDGTSAKACPGDPREPAVSVGGNTEGNDGRASRHGACLTHLRAIVGDQGATDATATVCSRGRRRPRRGTKPREGRPPDARTERSVVRTHPRSKASRDDDLSIRQEWRSRQRRRPGGSRIGRLGKSEEARNAETRHGCGGGEPSEGYETSMRGNAPSE